jgi:hypothetical protein
LGQVLWVMPGICGHPGRIAAATPSPTGAGSRVFAATALGHGNEGLLRGSGSAEVVGVGEPLAAVVPVLDGDRAHRNQFLKRTVNRVGGLLMHPPRESRA